MDFNMNRTWSQAMALTRANFQLLAVIAGVFLLLPGVVMYLAMPDVVSTLQMSQNPEQISQIMGEMLWPLLGFGLVVFVLQMIGYSAMIALMGDARPTVAEALRRGVKCLPTIIGATLIFALIYLAISFVLGVIVMLLAGLFGAGGGEAAAMTTSAVLIAALFLAVLYVATRLSLTLPVIVLGDEMNPAAALRKSWRITAAHVWAIFGFYLLLTIAYIVISMLLMGILGVVGAAFGPGAGSMLFLGIANGLIGALVAMGMSGILVSMHRQLAGRPNAATGTPSD